MMEETEQTKLEILNQFDAEFDRAIKKNRRDDIIFRVIQILGIVSLLATTIYFVTLIILLYNKIL